MAWVVTDQAADQGPLGTQLTEWLSRLGSWAGVWEDAIQALAIIGNHRGLCKSEVFQEKHPGPQSGVPPGFPPEA